jgi:rifampicin phosphotransferase
MRTRLESTDLRSAMLTIWEQEIAPHILHGVWCVLGSVTYSSDYALKLRRDLTRLVGSEDANILIANLSDQEDLLASLGLVASLAKLAQGEMTRSAYLEKYGHRGPHEFELSVPTPAEAPQWLDEQLENFRKNPIDIDALLAKQQTAFQEAWERLKNQHPRQAGAIQKRIRENARRARLRELARSEYTRDRWLIRLFALRAAELTGLGNDIFFLTLSEVLNLLSEDHTALGLIPSRKKYTNNIIRCHPILL